MKAYIKTFEEGNGYRAEVVTEDDYHNRGPFSRSYLTSYSHDAHWAWSKAMVWCDENNITVVEAKDI